MIERLPRFSFGEQVHQRIGVARKLDLGEVSVHQLLGQSVRHTILNKVIAGLEHSGNAAHMAVIHLFNVIKSDSFDAELSFKCLTDLVVHHLRSLVETVEHWQVLDIMLLAHVQFLKNFLKSAQAFNKIALFGEVGALKLITVESRQLKLRLRVAVIFNVLKLVSC